MKYITSTFSLAMLPQDKTTKLVVDPIPAIGWVSALEEYVLDEKTQMRIGHMSTAQVFADFVANIQGFWREPEYYFSREPMQLKEGDSVLVFQPLRRPKEGQVYTEEEIREMLYKGLFNLVEVRVEEVK